MTYYPIDEDLAKRSHNMMSFREYSEGSTTSSYRARIDSAREDLEKELSLCVTELQKERARMYFERYCKVLAFAINEDNRIGCMCPSVMIAGPAKFPTKKKEKQVSTWESNRFNYVRADNYLYLMKNVHNQGIQSDDPEALAVLKNKLEALQEKQEEMKAVNAYWRKHGTLEGYGNLTDEQVKEISEDMERFHMSQPYPSYNLQNGSARIRQVKDRIADLEKAKESEDVTVEYDGFTCLENSGAMRVQFVFDGKPNEETRAILKSHGFRWAPSQGAWQRQLTANGKYAAKQVIEELKE